MRPWRAAAAATGVVGLAALCFFARDVQRSGPARENSHLVTPVDVPQSTAVLQPATHDANSDEKPHCQAQSPTRLAANGNPQAPAATQPARSSVQRSAVAEPLTQQEIGSLLAIVNSRKGADGYAREMRRAADDLVREQHYFEAVQLRKLVGDSTRLGAAAREERLEIRRLANTEQKELHRDAPYGARRGLFECWVSGCDTPARIDQAARLSALTALRDVYDVLGPDEKSSYLNGVQYLLENISEPNIKKPPNRSYVPTMIMDLARDITPTKDIGDSVAAYANSAIDRFVNAARNLINGERWEYFDQEDSRTTTQPLVAYERLSTIYPLDPARVGAIKELLDKIEEKAGPLDQKTYPRYSYY